MANLDFDDLMDEFEDEVISSAQTDSINDIQKNIGGFQDMSSEQIEQFQNSQEYKEFKADITEGTEVKAN